MKRTAIVLIALAASSILGGLYLFSPLMFYGSHVNGFEAGEDEAWILKVDGLVDEAQNLTYNDLLMMPSKTVTAKLWCVGDPTGEYAYTANWTGAPLGTILEKAGVLDSAIKVAFYAKDGFSTDLSLETAFRPDVIVAYKMNGTLISEEAQGYPPLRLIVPGKWGYKWIKWLIHMEVVNYDFKGFYESRGYSDEADYPRGADP